MCPDQLALQINWSPAQGKGVAGRARLDFWTTHVEESGGKDPRGGGFVRSCSRYLWLYHKVPQDSVA